MDKNSTPSKGLIDEVLTFPWSFFLAALSLLIAGHVIGTETWNWAKIYGVSGWLRVILPSALILACSAALKSRRHAGSHGPWYFGIAAVIGTNWLGLEAHDFGHHWGWIAGVFALVVFMKAHKSAQDWLHRQPPVEDRGHATTKEDLAKNPPKLAIFLLSTPSPLRLPMEVLPYGPVELTSVSRDHSVPPVLALTLQRTSLDEDVLALEMAKERHPHFNWQQQLRALRSPGFSDVPEIVFVGSSDDYLEKACAFFKPYVSPNTHLHPYRVDAFNDFNSIQNCLIELIRLRKVNPQDVVVDITGGYAITSVSATVFTARTGTRIQWIPTSSDLSKPDPEILQSENRYYDIRELLTPFPSEI